MGAYGLHYWNLMKATQSVLFIAFISVLAGCLSTGQVRPERVISTSAGAGNTAGGSTARPQRTWTWDELMGKNGGGRSGRDARGGRHGARGSSFRMEARGYFSEDSGSAGPAFFQSSNDRNDSVSMSDRGLFESSSSSFYDDASAPSVGSGGLAQ